MSWAKCFGLSAHPTCCAQDEADFGAALPSVHNWDMKFRTTLLQSGPTATGFVVPDEVVEALGSGKRPPVRVTINGYTYSNTVAVMGGEYMVGVSAEHRASPRAHRSAVGERQNLPHQAVPRSSLMTADAQPVCRQR